MYGTMNVHVVSAELYDINNYSFNNLKAKFKVIIDSHEMAIINDDNNEKEWICESNKVGKYPYWDQKKDFNINGETQFCLDIYDTDPKNTRSVRLS